MADKKKKEPAPALSEESPLPPDGPSPGESQEDWEKRRMQRKEKQDPSSKR